MLARSVLLLVFTSLTALAARAQFPIITEEPENRNVRAAWAPDLDGGNGGEWEAFEIAYASRIYPLDQMVLSYGFASPDGATKHSVTLAIEEQYPLSDVLIPYGLVGAGHMWNDLDSGLAGDDAGWFVKLGAGLLLRLTERVGLYAELAYHRSDRDLWRDDASAGDHNVSALAGLRFHY